MARIRAVLFDIDGTLLDSNDAQAHAWLDALRGHGRDVPLDRVRSAIGRGGEKALMELAQLEADSPQGRLLSERRSAVFKAHYLPDLGPFPGARTLVDRLRSRGYACCAVTSAGAAEAADLLRAAAVADLFDHVVTIDDADRSKPEPDLVMVALAKLEVGPREAVFIGDAPYDIEAAARAGVATIAFRSGGWRDRDLDGAIALYDGPQDLGARLERSPLALGVSDELVPAPPISVGRRRRAAMRGI